MEYRMSLLMIKVCILSSVLIFVLSNGLSINYLNYNDCTLLGKLLIKIYHIAWVVSIVSLVIGVILI